jgi:hypothetical protein
MDAGSKYYNYGVKHFLSKDLDSINSTDHYISVVICAYLINTNGQFPFVQYLLTNNGYNNLTLPKLPVYSLFNKDDLIPYSQVYLSGLLQSNKFEEFSNNISFDGFYEYNNDLYLFFDITNCEVNVDETYLTSNVRFGIIDEIVNHRNVCNMQIDDNVSTFFTKNESLNYLYDECNNPYEIPSVGFVGKPSEQKTNFVMMFGESAKNKSAILGPYFYFTNFTNAIKNVEYKKGGIVRFALFTGKTKYIENAPNDPNDNSEIKRQRLEDSMLDNKKEILTLRISDHDGNWAQIYDSAYLGKLELDDGSLLVDTPMIVLKNYNQQVPLSCHIVDRRNIGENIEENKNSYTIL